MTTEEMNQEESASGLSSAPEHVKLAVDLIYLLEDNQIDVGTALAALEIVKQDLLAKSK